MSINVRQLYAQIAENSLFVPKLLTTWSRIVSTRKRTIQERTS